MNNLNCSCDRTERAIDITRKVLWGNVLLTIFKAIAGILGRSSAMVADALHSLSDIVSDLVVLVGFKFSAKPPDRTHPYGHGKVETFVAFFIGILLCFVGFGIMLNAGKTVLEFFKGAELATPRLIALLMAFLSIVFKEVFYRWTVAEGKRLNSTVLIANAWHHRSDSLSSLAALFGISASMFLGKSWAVLDPCAAIIVAFFVLNLAYSVIKLSLNELLEASLGEKLEREITEIISAVAGVKEIHKLRTRRIGAASGIDVHICVAPDLNIVKAHDVSTLVENVLKDRLGQELFVNIHIEPYGYDKTGG